MEMDGPVSDDLDTATLPQDDKPKRKPESKFLKATANMKLKVAALASWIDRMLFGSVGSEHNQPYMYREICMQAWTWNDRSVLHRP